MNYMGYMRISGTEPSTVILTQTKKFNKLKWDALKAPKQAEVPKNIKVWWTKTFIKYICHQCS